MFQAANRLGVSEHPQAHFVDGGVARPLKLTLVVRELLRRHSRRFRRGKQRAHRTVLLGKLYRLVAGKQAVEHLAHVVVELHIERGQFFVHREQPGAQAREDTLQLHRRRLALHQVGLKLARHRFMVVAALFQRHPVPVVQRVARLADEGVHVLQYLDFALGERAAACGVVAGA